MKMGRILDTSKEIKCYPNKKPWVSKELKELLNLKKKAFLEKDQNKIKESNKLLKLKVAEGKKRYKEKIEHSFRSDDIKTTWATGYATDRPCVYKNEKEYVNDLNSFYVRFYCYDFSEICNNLRSELREQVIHAYDPIATYRVRRSLTKINTNKACGADRLSGQLLKCCSDQLAEIFTYIFNLSITSMIIPKLWKTAEIIPVPRRSKIESMNDLRPVTLTPVIMKVFERFVLKLLLNEVK